MKYVTFLLLCIYLLSIRLNAQNYSEIIQPYLEGLVLKGELKRSDINWVLLKEHVSSISDIHHLYFNQTINGITISNTESSIHIDEEGNVISSNINFIKNSISKYKQNETPQLSSLDALGIVYEELGYSITEPLKIVSKGDNFNQKVEISKGGISESNITAQLNYFSIKNIKVGLAWKLNFIEVGYKNNWQIYIDAITGEVIEKRDLIIHCSYENIYPNTKNKSISFVDNETKVIDCQNCYEVVPMPFESPYFGKRSIIVNPSNNIASPFGWHDVNGATGSEYYTTKGNNVDAYIGTSGNDGYQPNGGVFLEFIDYPFSQDFTIEDRLEDASITNLFYWGNVCHDILYQYGFNEEAGNFQENNYSNGGIEDDAIVALGQIQFDFCNAYFIPTEDGGRSTINMNVCGDKDGNFDNMVIIHEYIHGLTIRSFGYGCTNKEVPFEGWSDWYALMFTLTPESTGENPRGFATYLLDQGADGPGGRIYPYSTNMDINPQTYNFIKKYDAIHNIGSVWTSILWELTWTLIDEYGYDPDIYNFTGDINQDAGNIIALAIVTEAIKMGNCTSGFVDARDNILTAYSNIYQANNSCLLWESFAKRGLGFYAYEGSSEDTTDGEESFDVPPTVAQFDFYYPNICYNSVIKTNLSGGVPTGGIYNGKGIIDDGNGLTFSFDPAIAGIGLHSVFYEINDSSCTEASIDVGFIEVISDALAPEINCPEELIIDIANDEDYFTVISYLDIIDYVDNCTSNIMITQNPSPGTQLDVGEHIIEFEFEDASGNQSHCSFNLIIEKDSKIIEELYDLYPNPTEDKIILETSVKIDFLKLFMYDVNGKIIFEKEFNNFGFDENISLKYFANGIYFFRITNNKFNVIKKIIKK